MRKIHVALACLATIGLAPAAQASLISYSDRVAWENSVRRPRFSWTHISEEYDVEGGWNE